MEDCIFCKIINNELPSTKVYEDDDVLAFRDINPMAKTHVLVVPKKHISSLNELDDSELAGKLLLVVPKIAQKLGVGDAYRSVINTGTGVGQSVFHIHIHILGGQELSWP
ncbi:MAG: histidine triad nucleotide-binding protein [Caldisericia bacterium]